MRHDDVAAGGVLCYDADMTFVCKEREKRDAGLITALTEVWESSVRATHSFLSADETANIKHYVPQALRDVGHLIVAEDEGGAPVAFAGIEGRKLEMLFVAASHIGQGIGKNLLSLAVDTYGVNELTVNERNARATGFYEHMGFRAYKRSERDEQGGVHPILYMKKA